jgi:starch phosphorylase
MKFMMNGALTLGTRDGATIEMAREAGERNLFLFGLTADQVADSRGWYDPHWHYDHEPQTRAALDLLRSGHFSRGEPGLFMPLFDALLTHGDYYMHLADLKSYLEAHERMCELYANPDEWALTAILNVAASGKFSRPSRALWPDCDRHRADHPQEAPSRTRETTGVPLTERFCSTVAGCSHGCGMRVFSIK